LNQTKILQLVVIGLMCLTGEFCLVASAKPSRRPFTVADEIGMVQFGDPYTSLGDELAFSPNGDYFVVKTERGSIRLSEVEDSLRFYSCQEVEDFLKRSSRSEAPSPFWVVHLSARKGGSIKEWRWLPDSSGLAFLMSRSGDNYRLAIADLRKKSIEPLTSATVAVDDFDVRDRQHYVYTGTDPTDLKKPLTLSNAPAIVGTERLLSRFLTGNAAKQRGHRDFYLWAVVNGKRFEVKCDGSPVIPDRELALSPDGDSVVAALPVAEVPTSWETLYPPPFATDAHRIRAGQGSAYQWVRISLRTSSIQSLTGAPSSIHLGTGLWAEVFSRPRWSKDGLAVLLPGTFLDAKLNRPSRPCVAVVELTSSTITCVELLKGHTDTGVEEGFHNIRDVNFAGGDERRVVLGFQKNREEFFSVETTEYQHMADGTWQAVFSGTDKLVEGRHGLAVTVHQGLNDPPQLVATNKRTSRVIWDPNPQLKSIGLGEARVYRWKDKEGRDWRGGLFTPMNYEPTQHYPLVIQTHGFTESKFLPSGIFPTGFAARALAAAGMVVLQVEERPPCPVTTPGEGPCVVSGYEAAANQLVSEGLVDASRIGIIGFSRTCFYVLETLTTSSLRLKAASITDGFIVSYLQFMMADHGDGVRVEANSMIGAPPFGDGLEQWLKRSPGFNLDKVNTPLLVVGEGPLSVLHMWEPYAGLRYLHKPVDLIMLNTDEHVLSNPAVRLASQGGSVDWFRFWLKDEEDPDPAKAEQYARWRELRSLQTQNDRGK
jgi:dipeptidyl aminopeptidase/acylaminoacyl peptidase